MSIFTYTLVFIFAVLVFAGFCMALFLAIGLPFFAGLFIWAAVKGRDDVLEQVFGIR